jgi:hypothetical protein
MNSNPQRLGIFNIQGLTPAKPAKPAKQEPKSDEKAARLAGLAGLAAPQSENRKTAEVIFGS